MNCLNLSGIFNVVSKKKVTYFSFLLSDLMREIKNALVKRVKPSTVIKDFMRLSEDLPTNFPENITPYVLSARENDLQDFRDISDLSKTSEFAVNQCELSKFASVLPGLELSWLTDEIKRYQTEQDSMNGKTLRHIVFSSGKEALEAGSEQDAESAKMTNKGEELAIDENADNAVAEPKSEFDETLNSEDEGIMISFFTCIIRSRFFFTSKY
jgi:hypothetical protein